MATRGRKPLPTAIKILEGDRGHGRRPYNKNEPVPPQDNVECPEWLMDDAKQLWAALSPSLVAMGILTEHDVALFAAGCQAYARYLQAEQNIERYGDTFKTPSGYIQQVPWVSISQQQLKLSQSIFSEFGLTPASRARLYAATGEKPDTEDPMENVLSGGWKVVQ